MKLITLNCWVAAGLAIVTPRIMDTSPKILFSLLAVFTFAGVHAAWIGFRKGTTNEFEAEDQAE